MELSLQHSQHSALNKETKALCSELDRFVTLIAKHGYRALPYRPSAITHFDSLDASRRHEILTNFQNYARLCASIDADGVSFKDSPSLTRSVLRKLGLNGPRSFFEGMGSEDLVEIYSSDGIQIFRNFVFYEFCTYTLLDLISYPWYELLERHPLVNEKIMEHITRVMGDCNDVIPSTIGPHNVRELFSEEKSLFVTEFHRFAPLFAGAGVKKGFICSGKLRFIPHQQGAVTFISGRA